MQKTAYLNARHEIETDDGDAEGSIHGGSCMKFLDVSSCSHKIFQSLLAVRKTCCHPSVHESMVETLHVCNM